MANPYTPWTKEWIIADKTAVEAGYVNNPSDPGKETNYGITAAKAAEYKTQLVTKFNWNGKMKDLTKEMAFFIYDVDFWQKLNLTAIHKRCPAIADKLFDIGINAGQGRAGMWFQNILNSLNMQAKLYPDLKVDGDIGNASLAAYDALVKARGMKGAAWTILKSLLCMQGTHYITIAQKNVKLEDFVYGWMNRLDHNLVDYYKTLSGSK